MLKKLRQSSSLNIFLCTVLVCFFVLARTKAPSKPLSKPIENPPVVISETTPVVRMFSRQLNRHRQAPKRVVAKAPKKKSFRVAHFKKLQEMAETGLSESPQGTVFNIDPYESETLLDRGFSLAVSIPRELPLSIHEGILVASNTSSLWETLESYPAAPKLVAAVNSPELERPVVKAPPETQPAYAPLQAAPTEIQPLIEQGKNILQSIQKNLAPPAVPSAPSAPKEPSVSSQPKKNSNQNPIPGVEASRGPNREPVGQIYGKLHLDTQVQEWLDQNQGHVELTLQKSESRDPQDAFFVEYQYPESEFSWDGRNVTGSYQLVAKFFNPNKSVPVAEVTHPTPLTSETAKRRVIFNVNQRDVHEAVRSVSATHSTGVVLSGTVFEANPTDHRSEKTISTAEIEVVGYPELGAVSVDKEGTFRIPNVTAHSEYLIQVKADGYYPTQVVVPVFQSNGYVSVHLVAKNTVDTITGFFTKRPQSEQKGLILGRVFDPETRSPQSDQEIRLAGRTASALYFNLLPEPKLRQTTSTGSFAYFNVDPAFRALGKEGSSISHLLQVKPGSAYYLESGRGGKQTLAGKLYDPYRRQPVSGLVKIVGSQIQAEALPTGEFEIQDIDLPAGVITLEVEAEGYPKSWHTIPWSPREARPSYNFYLPESDLVDEARTAVARVSNLPQRGVLIGGAEPKFFAKTRQCIYVSLEKPGGSPVTAAQGPYPLHQSSDENPSQGLCLSPQRPGFAFFNLEPGEYLLKWRTAQGKALRSHVVRAGSDRVSILIN